MNIRSSPFSSMAMTLALLALGLMAPGWVRVDQANASDTDRAERGYYEALADAGRRLDQVGPGRIEAPSADFGPLTLPVADVREYVLKPGVSILHRGARWSTNARGMRDRDYEAIKPANAYRIGLVGDSIGSAWGVEDGQGFEPVWERRIGFEVLNHAVPGLAPGQRWEHFHRVGWDDSPDLVVFQGTPADFGWDDRKLRSILPRGLGWEALAYREILADISPGLDEESYKNQLRPRREAILAGVYRAVVEDCRSHGVPSVWLLLPRVGKVVVAADRSRMVALAKSAGFTRVVDLSDAFEGLDPATIAIAPGDFHPNARGHAVLADRLARALQIPIEASGDDRR